VAGHSYSTGVAVHVLRRQQGTTPQGVEKLPQEENHTSVGGRHRDPTTAHEPIIAAVLLIDPIPFLLHHPTVTFNFVYRYPRHDFVSCDPDIARTLARDFFWFENIIFCEDVMLHHVMGAGPAAGEKKPPVAVRLAGHDQIVDTHAV
jgi:hypothetical protein